jgi:toxin-antitoxin system PIN domain toxin
MIVFDANILIYATDPDTPQHPAAHALLLKALEGIQAVGLPIQSVSAFLRISTQNGVLQHPFSTKEALQIADEWLQLRHVRLLVPGDRYWPIFRRMLLEGHVSGRSVTDAEIAAVTIEYGGELQTTDRGFARYPGLRWNNPLAKA